MSGCSPTQLAYKILAGFDKHLRLYNRITLAAKDRFARADWQAVQAAQKERITLYSEQIDLQTLTLIQQLDKPVISTQLWRDTKAAYSHLLQGHPQAELAETFFNSVFSRLFQHRGLDNQHLYLHSDAPPRPEFDGASISQSLPLAPSPPEAILTLVQAKRFSPAFDDLERDIALLWQRLEPDCQRLGLTHIELLNSVFYRNKGAYLVGRLTGPEHSLPLMLPIRHSPQGLYIDALLTDPDELSIVFSFTRSYFMVNCDRPAVLTRYLKQLMPNKGWAELYTAIGFQKHGKTEFYRHFLHHLAHSDDQFVVAPGIKGMVMAVFTLPSLRVVFKIIKDKFTPPKDSNKAQVKAKYELVKQHDRVGRMADTQEYSNFVLPRDRFDPELLEELLQVAADEVELTETEVVIRHLYVERHMTPLNLYLDQATPAQLSHAVFEYGLAIKQLASSNIFPGDMLFKNFGVTRHGRVVFYDYDEISYMTECNFRTIPKPRYPEDEWAAEPWYSVAPMDIFPEEFGRFLLVKKEIKQAFMRHHSNLLTAEYWQGLQQDIAQHRIPDFYPYRKGSRLRRVI
ncbi:bifunctional isocitrate dehydrogenase kinase/phosphatase [Ferrimonas pelagia]|uniref:Isocitrate dehydrogenase kinase/phosphatase n=1 Tax=Ferrimonas pelagia TaxID=1177826 RepID=A0ABP9EMB0_9GAMM